MLLPLQGRRLYYDLTGPEDAPTICITRLSLRACTGGLAGVRRQSRIAPEEVRVRVEFAAPKHGTELHMLRGDSAFGDSHWDADRRVFLPGAGEGAFPRPLGNIAVGRVTELGTSAVGVVTSRMFASGAVAWAHSTSSATSRSQRLWYSRPVPLFGGGGFGAGQPWTQRMSKRGDTLDGQFADGSLGKQIHDDRVEHRAPRQTHGRHGTAIGPDVASNAMSELFFANTYITLSTTMGLNR